MINAHYAVGVFIVLSGFCLMLPVAKSADGQLPGGFRGFLARRCRRILPPYYAALICVTLLVVASHKLMHHHSAQAADLSPGNLLAHVLLAHNLSSKLNQSLDPPMWSVALEWQIYFVFALLLLPVWRKLGAAASAGMSLALGFGALALPGAYNLAWTCPWFLGLFGLGMAAAVRYANPRPFNHRAINTVSIALCAILALVEILRPQAYQSMLAPLDMVVGSLTALVILSCSRPDVPTFVHRKLLAVFQAPAVVAVGAFSYSLYLIHYPIVQKVRDMMLEHREPVSIRLAAVYLVAVPVSLLAAYIFHLLFEKPFLSSRAKQPQRIQPAATANADYAPSAP